MFQRLSIKQKLTVMLMVISGSVSDAQPVFQKILQSCRRLFGEQSTATSILLIGDDDRYHLIDYIGPRREAMMKQFPRARADALLLLGKIAVAQDRNDEAIKLLESARKLHKSAGNRAGLARWNSDARRSVCTRSA